MPKYVFWCLNVSKHSHSSIDKNVITPLRGVIITHEESSGDLNPATTCILELKTRTETLFYEEYGSLFVFFTV